MEPVPIAQLPIEKHDEVVRMAFIGALDIVSKAGKETFEMVKETNPDGTHAYVPLHHYRDVLVYGGPTRMRVIDSLEEAIDIFYKCNCCVDDDDHPRGPHLWVLSPNTYCHIMSRADGLRYIEPNARTLLSVPYQINPRIR